MQPSLANREKLKIVEGELRKWLSEEEEFWKQKAGTKWLQDGDKNTKFFHSYVKGRRRKLHIGEIISSQGETLSEENTIGDEAVRFYSQQFQDERLSMGLLIVAKCS